MRALILTAVCGTLMTGVLTAAPIPKMKEKTTEEKVYGKWKLVKTDAGPINGFDFVIEYKPKGEMSFTRTLKNGKATVSPGKYTVMGDDKLDWKVTENGRERGETSKIKLLTADKLILEDPDGLKEEFERVVEKKDEKDEKKEEKKEEK